MHPNGSEEILVIQKDITAVQLTYVIKDFIWEQLVITFYERQLNKANQKIFRIGKIIKKKGNKLYLKWKTKIILLTIEWFKKMLFY